MEKLTFDQIWGMVVVGFVLLGAYNILMTAVKNRRDMREYQNKPIHELQEKMVDMENKYNELERKVVAIEKDSADLHTGLMAVCQGIQAQLNHSLTDGNEDEMRGALSTINKWLRTR